MKYLLIIISFLTFNKLIGNDSTKININISLLNVNTNPPIGLYFFDDKKDDVIDFIILNRPYNYSIVINNKEYPKIKILAQDVNIISDTILIDLINKEEIFVNLTVRNRLKAIDLPEVVVKAQKIKNNDTLSFDAKKLTTASTYKAEDLIANIEGIKIDEEGKITFNNKPITKVMVNGDNITGDNYSFITKNLNGSNIEKVQVIKNESNNRLLANVQKSNDVALNLVLKKITPKFNPSFDLGYANKKKYLVNANSLFLFKKISIFSIFNTNTIAERPSFKNLDSEKNLYFINGNKIGAPSLPNRYTQNNNDIINSHFGVYKVNAKIILNSIIENSETRNENNATNSNLLTIPNVIDIKSKSIFKNDYTTHIKSYKLSIDYDSKKNNILRSNLTFKKLNSINFFKELSSGDILDSLQENLNQNINTYIVENQLTKKISNSSILQIETKNSISKNTENLIGKTNRLNTFFSDNTSNINLIDQRTDLDFYQNNIVLRLNHNNKINYNISLNYHYDIYYPKNNINFKNNNQIFTFDSVKKKQFFIKFKPTINTKKYYVSVLTEIGVANFKNFNKNINLKNKLIYDISAVISNKRKTKITKEISISSKSYFVETNNLTNIIYLSNLSNLNTINTFNKILKENKIGFSIKKDESYNGFIKFISNFIYNPTSLLNNSFFENGLFKNSFSITNNNYGYNNSINIERYSFFLKLKYFVDLNSNFSNNFQTQNNQKTRITNFSNGALLKIVTNFKKISNFEIQLSYNNSTTKQVEAKNSYKFNNYGLVIKHLQPFTKKIKVGNTLRFIKYNNITPLYLYHSSIGYVSANKRIKIEILFHNIFNTKSFTSNQTNSFSQSSSSFELVPRYLLAKCSLQF